MLVSAKTYLRSLTPPEKKALITKCGITRGYFYNLLAGSKRPSAALACRIERFTSGRVTRREVLPDVDWELLAGTDVVKD